ncbi:MAG: helix-turn-helix transcriptional regulator [Hyphomicrobiales bacterium]|nr:helix-turn-helix transcriptional regulator [Hyphomicrobiales bacterium]
MAKTIYSEKHRLLCDMLRRARRAADISQAELAGQLGKPQSFVAKYERGERRIDVAEFTDIAAALDIAPAEFIAEFVERTKNN